MEMWLAHLRDHSDGLVAKLDGIAISALQFHHHEAIHSSIAVVGDVLLGMGILEPQESQWDLTLGILKL